MPSRQALAALAIALASANLTAHAQPAAPALPTVNAPAPASTTLTPEQLDALVAPIALYPDPVLTDILAAATYPAQVVEAHRFAAEPGNSGLRGNALAATAAEHGWDPSVVALLQFPSVLQLMDDDLEWTEHLGSAFMAQQADVLAAVQRLRQQAERAGTLKNGWQETVVNDGGNIAIDPPSSQYIYLPTYDPDCVYAPNPACTPDEDELAWDHGILFPFGFWDWGVLDWGSHLIHLQHRAWNPGPAHARNVSNTPDHRGDIWRHTGVRGFTPRPAALAADYQYAPAANPAFGRSAPYGHAVPAHRFIAPFAFRPAAPVPVVIRSAPMTAHATTTGATHR